LTLILLGAILGNMITKQVQTSTATIYIAGPIEEAKQIIRRHCKQVGLCVTVEPTTYIYTFGEEAGYKVGFINYPRFPTNGDALHAMAVELGKLLMEETHQGSFTVVGPHYTEFFSIRPGDK
jgi:hypothetical protein